APELAAGGALSSSGATLSGGAHFGSIGLRLNPSTSLHVAPPCSLRKIPAGEVPAYQTPGSSASAGVSEHVWLTARAAIPSGGSPNIGGRTASVHVPPMSVERKTVGPRCPVRAAASIVRPSRGSSTIWLMICPRKWGPSTRHDLRDASP